MNFIGCSTGRRRFTLSGLVSNNEMMEVLLLLLCACFCVGPSYAELRYGSSFTMELSRGAKSLTFTPLHGSYVTVLWKRDEPPASEDSRRKVSGSLFMINSLTQKDSGTYIARDKNRVLLSVRSIRVVAQERYIRNDEGEGFSFDYDLEPTSCNIYFIPEGDSSGYEIVHQGTLWPDLKCSGFDLSGYCGILNTNPQKLCSGRYEVRDSEDNEALVVTVDIKSSSFDAKEIGLGFGIFFAVVGCCGCLKRCCCGKSSSKEEQPETPDEEPAVHYHEYDHEPVGPRQEQLYPAQPTHTPSVPLIHNPPTVVPPAYSEIFSSPAEPTVAPTFTPTIAPTVSPTVPVQSDGQPRFELKGTSFSSAPPLSSDSPCGDVYTSEKLNFL